MSSPDPRADLHDVLEEAMADYHAKQKELREALLELIDKYLPKV